MATISTRPPPQGFQGDGVPPRTVFEVDRALRGAAAAEKGNGRPARDPAAVTKSRGVERQSKGGIEGLIGKRVAAATEHALEGPDQTLMRAQKPAWDVLFKYYFRLETSGWERLPEVTGPRFSVHHE
jgi:hypothetical protein